jgi:hypothetical protein
MPEVGLWQAVFQHLASLLAAGGVVTRDMTETPFYVDDDRSALVDPRRDIHRPHAMRLADDAASLTC